MRPLLYLFRVLAIVSLFTTMVPVRAQGNGVSRTGELKMCGSPSQESRPSGPCCLPEELHARAVGGPAALPLCQAARCCFPAPAPAGAPVVATLSRKLELAQSELQGERISPSAVARPVEPSCLQSASNRISAAVISPHYTSPGIKSHLGRGPPLGAARQV